MNLFDNYYIIRIGEFATNANTKIYYCLFTLYLCFDDYYNYKSSDCLMIMMYSTNGHLLNVFNKYRIIKPLYINNCTFQLPNHGIFLQGFQKGLDVLQQ